MADEIAVPLIAATPPTAAARSESTKDILTAMPVLLHIADAQEAPGAADKGAHDDGKSALLGRN